MLDRLFFNVAKVASIFKRNPYWTGTEPVRRRTIAWTWTNDSNGKGKDNELNASNFADSYPHTLQVIDDFSCP